MIPRYCSAAAILLLVVHHLLFGQEAVLRDIRMAYESFDYVTAVRLADKLLQYKDSLSRSDLLEIYLLRATSQFSLGDEAAARESFRAILALQPDYAPDSTTFSPKILRLFDTVRSEYRAAVDQVRQSAVAGVNRLATSATELARVSLWRGAVIRSLLLPGWGHAYVSDDPKSWMLLSASVAALGSMTYSIVATASRERDYLNETRPQFIQEKYDRYDSAYKLRNALIAAYAVLWLYTQIDLLLISDNVFAGTPQASVLPLIASNSAQRLTLTVNLGVSW